MNTETEADRTLDLTKDDYKVFYNILCEGKRKKKWEELNCQVVEDLFSDLEKLNKEVTAYELKDIVKY